MTPYGLLIKYGAMVLGVLAVLGMAFYYGADWKQTQWDAAVAQQQIRTGEFIVQQAHETARADREHHQRVQQLSSDVRRLSKKVRDYELGTSKKCELSAEFERVFDHISRLRESAADGLPAATEPTGLADATDAPGLTDVAILPAYQGAVGQLYACTEQLNALIAWVANATRIATEGAGRRTGGP